MLLGSGVLSRARLLLRPQVLGIVEHVECSWIKTCRWQLERSRREGSGGRLGLEEGSSEQGSESMPTGADICRPDIVG